MKIFFVESSPLRIRVGVVVDLQLLLLRNRSTDLELSINKLLREVKHENVVNLLDIYINPNDKSLNLVFDYAEYDLFVSQRLHYTTK